MFKFMLNDFFVLALYLFELCKAEWTHIFVSPVLLNDEFSGIENYPKKSQVELIFGEHLSSLNGLEHVTFYISECRCTSRRVELLEISTCSGFKIFNVRWCILPDDILCIIWWQNIYWLFWCHWLLKIFLHWFSC